MNPLRLSCLLLALACAAHAFAEDADPRKARVTDRAAVESQVSGLTVSNVDLRFGFASLDSNGRLIVTTQNVVYAIPVRTLSSVVQQGSTDWTVKFMTEAGETSIEGTLPNGALLLGNSDFGSFSLALPRLRRLEFTEPGAAPKPAIRPTVYDRNGHPRPDNYDATVTLTDGTKLDVTLLRRNEAYAESLNNPLVLNTAPEYTIVSTNYTDLSLIRGETLQTVPFENITTAEFLPGNSVLIKTRGGAEAEMKLPRRDERSLEGFTGFSSKGDFYIPLRFIKIISFGDAPK